MIYVLLEQECNIINPIEPDFIKRYNKSSIKRFGNERLDGVDLSIFDRPPLFDNEWLIICQKLNGKNLQACKPEKNTLLMKVTKRNMLEDVLSSLGSFQYLLIDNYNVDKSLVLTWIEQRLGVGVQLSKYLYNLEKGSLKLIVAAVEQLALMPVVNRSIIDKYVERARPVSIFSITQYLLGLSTEVAYKEIVSMLYEYRYAVAWFKESLLSELNLYLEVYTLMDKGEMTLMNFREVLQETDSKILHAQKEFRIQKIIESHKFVSTELVYYLMFQIKEVPNTVSGVRVLLDLLKVGGNNVYSM